HAAEVVAEAPSYCRCPRRDGCPGGHGEEPAAHRDSPGGRERRWFLHRAIPRVEELDPSKHYSAAFLTGALSGVEPGVGKHAHSWRSPRSMATSSTSRRSSGATCAIYRPCALSWRTNPRAADDAAARDSRSCV